MTHPSNRGERRHVAQVSQNRRRKHIVIGHWFGLTPQENLGWAKGRKQYQAHGNRCMHSMLDRHEAHTKVKVLRRERFFDTLEE